MKKVMSERTIIVWAAVLLLGLALPIFAAASTPVAMVDATPYATLQAAMLAAADGETVQLVDNATVTESASFGNSKGIRVDGNKQITLDLNGYNITGAVAGPAFSIREGGLAIVGSGSIDITGEVLRVIGNSTGTGAAYASSVSVGSGVSMTSQTDLCIFIYGNGAVADIYGSLTSKGVYATVMGNGSANNGGTTINVYNGAKIIADTSTAIYLPQDGVTNIYGGTIQGGELAIGLKSGTLNITGGIIRATGTYLPTVPRNNNGIDGDGSAILIDSHSGYAGNVQINIANASISSDNGHALREVYTAQAAGYTLPAIEVTSGSFTSAASLPTVIVSDETFTEGDVEVSGGIFSEPVDPDYIPDTAVVASLTRGSDTVYVLGASINVLASEARAGDELVFMQGSATLSDFPAGVTVKIETGASAVINGATVTETGIISAPAHPGTVITPTAASPVPQTDSGFPLEAAWFALVASAFVLVLLRKKVHG